MAWLQVRIHGAREVFTRLSKIQSRLPKVGLSLSKEIAEDIANTMRMKVRYNTGKLYASIQTMQMSGKNGYTVVVGRGLPGYSVDSEVNGVKLTPPGAYAYFMEKGFQPHWVSKYHVAPELRDNFGTFFLARWSPRYKFIDPSVSQVIQRMTPKLAEAAKSLLKK